MSSSSATTSATATASATAPPMPTDSGGSDISRTSNYFFGFLITFMGLLLLFLVCGWRSRRRLRQQQIIDLDALAGMPGFLSLGQPMQEWQKPTLWEPRLETTQGAEAVWAGIQPLSVSNTIETVPATAHQRPCRLPSRNLNAINGLSLPSWGPPAKKKQEEPPDTPPATKATTLQVAVIISMPHPPDDRLDAPIPEYQVGVSQRPWQHTG
ncbi:hypothetical protein CYLTODRAFT_410231 [Cylindrobasidium torrendii FP15055 ss-10]|uniref:Transmembrane protein n=1 Tax=Cylindrobasidium torrendii FP15055 ss-10 TaxID=1314674 RepID=A0A0D7BEZ9_9AGAR|nr:hypothetical protein CYLTODRAFT_410231 [Cylindrobasidium torrendii FP15055 ss-10]